GITAVTEAALARLRASIQKSSSTKLSFTGNAVPWIRKASRPRTFSSTRTKRLPSWKRSTSDRPSGQPRYVLISWASLRLPEPANSRSSSSTRMEPSSRSSEGSASRPAPGGYSLAGRWTTAGWWWSGEVALAKPGLAGQVDGTASRLKPLGKFFAPLGASVDTDCVPADHITERPELAEFHQHRPPRIAAHGHACFEQDVGPGLS